MEKIFLGSILHMTKGKKPKAQATQQDVDFLPYVDIKAFEKHIVDNYASPEKCLLCKEGDVLIVCDGARSGLVGRAMTGVVGSTLALISADGCSNDYLFYFLRSLYTLLNTKQKGTGTPHLNPDILKKAQLVVPSLPEQERIVAKIEELFSQLDAAVAELKSVKEKLAIYRQAVLKEAFDIALKFTEKTMAIEDFLTTERKGMATGPFGTMLKKHEHKLSGVPMLGIENIGKGKFVDGNKIFVTPEKAKELKSFALETDDIIISRSGTVGEICAVPARMRGALLSTNLMRVSLNPKKVLSEYFIYMFQSKGVVLDQVKELCKGSTRIFLNQTILKSIKFPIPSIPKQKQIIDQIESQISICNNIEQTVDTALQQATALRQSILKQAFEGNL